MSSAPPLGSSGAPATAVWQYAPLAVVLLVIGALFAWYMQFVGIGMIWRFDEYYTYERSISFARMDDWWAVYSANKPTLKKPPMQYWMSGALFEMGYRDVIALRVPSMIFAALTLIATAFLARTLAPGHPWTMLGAVLLLASSQTFWADATSAMLDVGSAFFVTIGLMAMLAAFQNRRYWPLFALTVFLGGMQKGPVALAFLVFALIALAVTGPLQKKRVREIVWNRHFAFWAFVSLVLAFAWQLYMGLRFPGEDAMQGSVEKEMFKRFFPSMDDIAAYDWGELRTLILGDDPWLRGVGTLALIALPFTAKRPILFALTGVGLFMILVMSAGSQQIHARYMLVIVPLQAAAIAAFLATLLRSDSAGLVASVALCFALAGPLQPLENLRLERENFRGATLAQIMAPVRENLQPDENLLICEMDPTMRFPRGAYTVYAADTREFTRLRHLDVAAALSRVDYSGGAIRGFCTESQLAQISDQLANVETSPLPGGYLQFRATGLVTPD